MTTNFFVSELEGILVVDMQFQQNSATCHTACDTTNLLKETFEERIISPNGSVNWSPRLYDLTTLDYFLWRYVKSYVYTDKPEIIEHLEANNRRVMVENCEESVKKLPPDYVTKVTCSKSYSKINAIKFCVKWS